VGSLEGAEKRCSADNTKYGCEEFKNRFYPKCAPGYFSHGCCICVKDGVPPPTGNIDVGP